MVQRPQPLSRVSGFACLLSSWLQVSGGPWAQDPTPLTPQTTLFLYSLSQPLAFPLCFFTFSHFLFFLFFPSPSFAFPFLPLLMLSFFVSCSPSFSFYSLSSALCHLPCHFILPLGNACPLRLSTCQK